MTYPIQTLVLHDLSAHSDNYKQHPPTQISMLKASLTRFGQVKPIVVQQRGHTYTVIAGHGIVQAATELTWSRLDAVCVPIDWTEADCRAYLVADNELAQNAQVDYDQLASLLQEQLALYGSTLSIGFSESEAIAIIKKLEQETLPEMEKEYKAQALDETLWPIIHLKVSPEVYALYIALLRHQRGNSERERFESLLTWAMSATQDEVEIDA